MTEERNGAVYGVGMGVYCWESAKQFLFVLLFTDYCMIHLYYNRKPTFPPLI